ncbi:hypothetical protein BD560DRAFT_411130 [Blakeslea trispora]|nr:hypothetical protein BD560DRAFT_411130 [Blakeslea trispora]
MAFKPFLHDEGFLDALVSFMKNNRNHNNIQSIIPEETQGDEEMSHYEKTQGAEETNRLQISTTINKRKISFYKSKLYKH